MTPAMQRRVSVVAVLGLLLVALPVGCGGDTYQSPPAESAAAPLEQLSSEQASKIDHAVEIARALEADPDRADEILQRHGMTMEQFDELLYEIAEDPVLSAAYENALQD